MSDSDRTTPLIDFGDRFAYFAPRAFNTAILQQKIDKWSAWKNDTTGTVLPPPEFNALEFLKLILQEQHISNEAFGRKLRPNNRHCFTQMLSHTSDGHLPKSLLDVIHHFFKEEPYNQTSFWQSNTHIPPKELPKIDLTTTIEPLAWTHTRSGDSRKGAHLTR